MILVSNAVDNALFFQQLVLPIVIEIRIVEYRLGPGEMLAVNVKEGKLYLNDEVKQTVVDKKPYAQLLKKSVTPIAKGSFKSGSIPT